MSSTSKILLFYDGTAEAKSALLRCAELGVALAALVDVVAVVDFSGASAVCAGMLSDVAVAQMEEQARFELKDAIEALGLKGVVARGHVAFGRAADEISRMIELLEVDMIVVGHRTKSRLERWYGPRPLHVDLVDKLKGLTIVSVTPI